MRRWGCRRLDCSRRVMADEWPQHLVRARARDRVGTNPLTLALTLTLALALALTRPQHRWLGA